MREASEADKQRLEAAETERIFAEIRALGHRVAASRDIMAVTDIACPVIGPGGHAEAAILVPCLQRHGIATDEDAILKALKASCAEAGSQLSL